MSPGATHKGGGSPPRVKNTKNNPTNIQKKSNNTHAFFNLFFFYFPPHSYPPWGGGLLYVYYCISASIWVWPRFWGLVPKPLTARTSLWPPCWVSKHTYQLPGDLPALPGTRWGVKVKNVVQVLKNERACRHAWFSKKSEKLNKSMENQVCLQAH